MFYTVTSYYVDSDRGSLSTYTMTDRSGVVWDLEDIADHQRDGIIKLLLLAGYKLK